MDKKIAHWYLSFNPTLERSLHGENVSRGDYGLRLDEDHTDRRGQQTTVPEVEGLHHAKSGLLVSRSRRPRPIRLFFVSSISPTPKRTKQSTSSTGEHKIFPLAFPAQRGGVEPRLTLEDVLGAGRR